MVQANSAIWIDDVAAKLLHVTGCSAEPPITYEKFGVDDLHPDRVNLVLMLSQLRQMLSTWQSGEVTMEHQQQPTARVV